MSIMDIKMNIKVIAAFFLFLFLYACISRPPTASECANKKGTDKNDCFYTLSLYETFKGNYNNAFSYCREIRGDDVKTFFGLVVKTAADRYYNECVINIAVKSKNVSWCNEIERGTFVSWLAAPFTFPYTNFEKDECISRYNDEIRRSGTGLKKLWECIIDPYNQAC